MKEFPTQHDQESRTTVSLFFYDPDLLSSYDMLTFFIKLLILRVRESPAAKLECREIHERIWAFLETFLIVNMLSLAILRKEGIEKNGSEEPWQSIPFQKERGEKSRRQMSPLSMTNHALGIWICTQVAWQFRVISTRRCICKIPWPNEISELDREFPSWSLCKSEESRARIAADQEIEASSSLKDFINLKSITGRDFSDYEELDLMMAAELKWCYDIAYLIYEITERRAVTRQEGRKILTPSGRLKNVFSGRQLGLVQEETLVVFYTRIPRETVRTTWNEVEIRRKFSPRASLLFSIESERHRLTKMLEQSKGQSCD